MTMRREGEVRTRWQRTGLGVAVCAAAAGLVVTACGGNESTVSGSGASATESSTTSLATPTPVTSIGPAATAPPETVTQLPSGFPGPAAPKPSDDDVKLLEELKRNNITPSQQDATAIAVYICNATKGGAQPEQIHAMVLAMVGSDPDSTKLAPEDAANIYIASAKKIYCHL